MTAAKFEWDDNKDAENQAKHSVAFQDAQHSFSDPHRVIAKDLAHSDTEERFYCIGKAGDGILTVRFTYRRKVIRIIGAGYWRKGKAIYEKKKSFTRMSPWATWRWSQIFCRHPPNWRFGKMASKSRWP